MTDQLHHRDNALLSIKEQWDNSKAITFEALDKMVRSREAAGVDEETIAATLAQITPGTTKMIYFLAENDKPGKIDVLKVFANSIGHAMEQLDAYGEFIATTPGLMPRVHKWAINT